MATTNWLFSLGELLDYILLYTSCSTFFFLISNSIYTSMYNWYLPDIIKVHPFLVCLESCSFPVPTFLS